MPAVAVSGDNRLRKPERALLNDTDCPAAKRARNPGEPILDPPSVDLYSALMLKDVGQTRDTALSPDAALYVRKALEQAGCRFTHQRAAVFAYLKGVNSHPTADDVYHAVRNRLPHISLATIYKALEALVVAGLATKLTNGDDSARYDCRGEDHYHLRDTVTGEVQDIPAMYDPELLAKLDPQLVQRLRQSGFQVTGYRLEVLGRFQPAESSE